MAQSPSTFTSVANDIAAGNIAPVYLLHGEEGYFIDALTKRFEALIPEVDRDFNLLILYAPEVEISQVVEACQRYPMMAERQVVILKEVQSQPASYLAKLAAYISHPNPTTVLVVCSRGAAVKSKEITAALKEGNGVAFESRKLKDNEIGMSISDIVRQAGLSCDPKALAMLKEFVGSDLSKIYNEISKLTISLPKGAMITPEVVERNIGVSKDYNNFELISAVSKHDPKKVFQILDNFQRNPKNHPVPVITTLLFNFFANMLICLYTPDKSDRALMNACGFRSSYQLIDIRSGLRYYNAWHVIEIISAIRRFDAQSKGNGSRQDAYDLLRDLLFRILHPTGKLNVK